MIIRVNMRIYLNKPQRGNHEGNWKVDSGFRDVCLFGAYANTFTSDFSDTWWNANESGWGVNVNHQRDIAFMTFFVYGNGGKAVWYTGQTVIVGQNPDGSLIFAGPVDEFSGPSLGSTFNPAMVRVVSLVTSRLPRSSIALRFLTQSTMFQIARS